MLGSVNPLRILIGSVLIALGWIAPLSGAAVSLTSDLNYSVSGPVRDLATQADGKIIVGGDFSDGVAFLRRIGLTGVVDVSFNPGINGEVTHLGLTSDGKIVVAGNFTSVAGFPAVRIVRLNSDGTRDASFSLNGNSLPGPVSALLVKPDGKILIAGATSDQTPTYWLRQLQANGMTDPGFAATINGRVATMALTSDGKILLGGSFSTVNGYTRAGLARVQSNGTTDLPFAPSANGAVSLLKIQADDKIFVAGEFTQIAGGTRSRIARLETGGSLDSGFTCSVDAAVNSIQLQANGKILLGGDFSDKVRLLTASGATDSAYSVASTVSILVLALEQDGRLLIGGRYTSGSNGYLRRAVATTAPVSALTSPAAGELKLTRGGSVPEVRAVTFDRWSGSDWVSLGAATRVTEGWTRTGLALPEGAWYRATASDTGTAPYEIIEPQGLVPDISLNDQGGTPLSSGDSAASFGSVDWLGAGAVRTLTVTNTGAADLTGLTLSVTGIQPEAFILTGPGVSTLAPGASATFGIQFIPGGGGVRKATLHVVSSDYDERVIDVNLSGVGIQQDASFQPAFNSSVHTFAVSAEGQILVGGRFTQVDGQARPYLVRFNSNGSLDLSFESPITAWVYGLKYLPDGKILVRTDPSTTGPAEHKKLVRLHDDGSMDPDFDVPADLSVDAIELLPDGKLLLITSVLDDLNRPLAQIVRLNANGSVDETFNAAATSSGAYGIYTNVVALQDGKFLVAGSFTQIQGESRYSIARFHPDGQLDTTFVPPPGIPSVNSIAVQANGQILLAGNVKIVDFQAVRGLIRLQANGAKDTSFNPLGDYGEVLAIQADGRVLMSGIWREAVGRTMLRLNADGSVDPTFNLGSQGAVARAALTPSGDMVVSGSFTELGGVSRNQLGRVPNSTPAAQSLTAPNSSEVLWQRSGSAPEIQYARFERWNGEDWVNLGEGQRVTGGWSLSGLALGQAGYIRARSESSGYVEGAVGNVAIEDQHIYNFTGAELKPVQLWRLGKFGSHANESSAANDFDADSDGAPNILEYAFGTDPKQQGSCPHPSLVGEIIDGVNYVTVSWPRNGTVAGVSWILEFSGDLASWANDVSRLTVLADTPTLLSVRMKTSPGPAFLRIRVTEE